MKALLVAAALLAATTASAAEWFTPPTRNDLVLQGVFAGALALDMWQTVDLGARCKELNPVLGRCPKPLAIAGWGVATFAGHTLVGWALPPKLRRAWQFLWIGMEVGTVTRNYVLFGARLTF